MNITLLVLGDQILHKDMPQSETFDELIYADVVYPKHIIAGYEFVTVESDLDIVETWLYWYNKEDNTIHLKETPPE